MNNSTLITYHRYNRLARKPQTTLNTQSNNIVISSDQVQIIAQPQVKPVKRALCIGIDYLGTGSQLAGCQADAKYVRQWLIDQRGFKSEDITMLLDSSLIKPTRQNILSAISTLVAGIKSGDVVYFHFSGHGSQIFDVSGDESDHYDETIIPLDYLTAGIISDDVLRDCLIDILPVGSTLNAVLDCCHSGTGLDLRYNLTGEQLIIDNNYKDTNATVHCMSGCRDNQTSADTVIDNKVGGACTLTYLQIMNERPNISLLQLSVEMNLRLTKNNYSQRPQITLGRPDKSSDLWFF